MQALFENIKIFSVTCFVRFLFPFEIWEYILPHPVPGEHGIQELHKTVVLGTAHILTESTNVKLQTQ